MTTAQADRSRPAVSALAVLAAMAGLAALVAADRAAAQGERPHVGYAFAQAGLSGSMRVFNHPQLPSGGQRLILDLETLHAASGHDCSLVAVERDPATRRAAKGVVSATMMVVDARSLEPAGPTFTLQLGGATARITEPSDRAYSCGAQATYAGRWRRIER